MLPIDSALQGPKVVPKLLAPVQHGPMFRFEVPICVEIQGE